MRIEIGKFLLTSDKLNTMLQVKTVKKPAKGEEDQPTAYGWSVATYHKNVEAALDKMIDLTANESEAEDYRVLRDELKALRVEMHEVLEQHREAIHCYGV